MTAAYAALFQARMRTLLQYRAAAWAGFVTQLFWGLIKVMVLEAFYRNAKSVPPLDLAQVVTYTWLGQAFFMLLPFSANPDPDVTRMMRTGQVAYELTRPLDLYTLWYSRAVANRLAPTLLRCAPMLIAAALFLGMRLPASPAAALAFGAAMLGALALVSAYATLITITLLWTVSGDGIARLAPALALIGSGLVIPLPLFPDWAQPILRLLPFRGMADAPFRVWLGDLPPEHVVFVLLHQIAWTIFFVIVGRLLLARGTRQLVVQGG